MLGLTFPRADDSVNHAVQQLNTALELGRKTVCLPGGGLKESHQVMLHEIEKMRTRIAEMPDLPPCDQARMAEDMFASYTGPEIEFVDEWKALFLSMESDVIGLVCTDNKVDANKALENMERITRSSYKSICDSGEVLTAISQESAIKATNDKLGSQIEAVYIARDSAAEKSGVNLGPVKDAVREAAAAVSCPSGLGVLTTHYQIMLAVLCAGFALALLLRR